MAKLECKFYVRSAHDMAVEGVYGGGLGLDFESAVSPVELFDLVDDPVGTNRQMTNSAMNGLSTKSYHAVTQERLFVGEPTDQHIWMVSDRYVQTLPRYVLPSIGLLEAAEIKTHIATGGFGRVLKPLIGKIDVPFHTNQIHLNRKTGKYTVLEDQSVLLLDGGKRRLMEELVESGEMPENFASGGDSPGDVKMGGSITFAITGFASREEAIGISDVAAPTIMHILPIVVGEANWRRFRTSTIFNFGLKELTNGSVLFSNFEFGEEVRARAELHLRERDQDVVHYFPKSGVIFEGR